MRLGLTLIAVLRRDPVTEKRTASQFPIFYQVRSVVLVGEVQYQMYCTAKKKFLQYVIFPDAQMNLIDRLTSKEEMFDAFGAQ